MEKMIIKKYILLSSILLATVISSTAQEEDLCSALGVWMWRFEQTGQPSHLNLARTIDGMGGKRIYVKVADGEADASSWSTLLNTDLVQTYRQNNVSPWAWSYNYRGNEHDQAEALYLAAKTGYEGYVIDIEIEFDGEDDSLEALLKAFFSAKQRAIADGYASTDFQLYVTTWGNPVLHNYRIDIIDPFVDGYMPQTYIEEWAGDHLSMIENCIEESKLEYQSLGATKPVHNILSTVQGILTAEEITHFFELSGPEASLWRVPGGGVSQQVWDRWQAVDWELNFCESVSIVHTDQDEKIHIYPNPVIDRLHLQIDPALISKIKIYRQDGQQVRNIDQATNSIDLSTLSNGMHYLTIQLPTTVQVQKFLKL